MLLKVSRQSFWCLHRYLHFHQIPFYVILSHEGCGCTAEYQV